MIEIISVIKKFLVFFLISIMIFFVSYSIIYGFTNINHIKARPNGINYLSINDTLKISAMAYDNNYDSMDVTKSVVWGTNDSSGLLDSSFYVPKSVGNYIIWLKKDNFEDTLLVIVK